MGAGDPAQGKENAAKGRYIATRSLPLPRPLPGRLASARDREDGGVDAVQALYCSQPIAGVPNADRATDGPGRLRKGGLAVPRSSTQRAHTQAARRAPASAGGGVFQAGALARDVRRFSAATAALAWPLLLSPGDNRRLWCWWCIR